MASNKASQAHTHDLTRPAKAAAEGGTVCKKSRQSHRIQTMGSQTSTPTPKLILRVALGKRKSFVGAKRNRLAVGFSILIACNQEDSVPNASSYL